MWTCVGFLAILGELDALDIDLVAWWLAERQVKFLTAVSTVDLKSFPTYVSQFPRDGQSSPLTGLFLTLGFIIFVNFTNSSTVGLSSSPQARTETTDQRERASAEAWIIDIEAAALAVALLDLLQSSWRLHPPNYHMIPLQRQQR